MKRPTPPLRHEPSLPDGFRVSVHYHLNRPDGCPHRYVLTPREAHPMRNRSFELCATVLLRNVTTKISRPLRQKIVDRKRRKVCAWVYGEIIEPKTLLTGCAPHRVDTSNWIRVTYNPYRSVEFHIAETGEPVTQAPMMEFRDGSAWIPPVASGR